MITIPDRTKYILMVTSNVVLLVAGIVLTSFGAHRYFVVRHSFEKPEQVTTDTTSGKINLCLGSIDIAVATFGLVCAHVRNRYTLIANMCLLFASAMGHLIFAVIYSVHINHFLSGEQIETRVAIAAGYGSRANPVSGQFTRSVDLIQQTFGCCDWGGAIENNIYLRTPWYRMVNGKDTAQIVIPDSCCVDKKPNCSAEVDSMSNAKSQGIVYATDCLDLIVDRFKLFVWLLSFQLGCEVIVLIICAIPPVFYALEGAKSSTT